MLFRQVYPLFKARKGRVCIISLPEFEVEWLQPLVGYKTDEMRLCELWDQMGFDVYTPKVEGRSLTAQVSACKVTEISCRIMHIITLYNQ